MKTQFLMTVSAAALSVLLGLTYSYAGPASESGAPPSGAPGAAQMAPNPAEPSVQSGAPTEGAMPGKGDSKSVAKPDGGNRDKVGEQTGMPGKETKGSANPEHEHGGKSVERSGEEPHGKSADMDRENKNKSADEGRNKEDRDGKRVESTDDRDHKAGDHKRAQFEPRDKEKVRTYFSEHKPNVTRVDRDRVRVSLGVGIPAAIALYPLPGGIVVAAADCPLQYFLWGDDAVIVDSCSREVVDIVPIG